MSCFVHNLVQARAADPYNIGHHVIILGKDDARRREYDSEIGLVIPRA